MSLTFKHSPGYTCLVMSACPDKFQKLTFYQWLIRGHCQNTKTGILLIILAGLLFSRTSLAIPGLSLHAGYIPLLLGSLFLLQDLWVDFPLYWKHRRK